MGVQSRPGCSRERVFAVVVKSFGGERTQDNLKPLRELARDATLSRIRVGRFEVGGYYCYRWEPKGPYATPLTQVNCEEISPGPFRSP